MKLFQTMIELPQCFLSFGMESLLRALSDSPSVETIFVHDLASAGVAYRRGGVSKSKSIKYIALLKSPYDVPDWTWRWQNIQNLLGGSVIHIVVVDGT
jgi:hypothetical protein